MVKSARLISGIALSALTIALSAPAAAQSTADQTGRTNGAIAADASEGLQDIIVTAQRVQESSQRAAIAIDVVDSQSLIDAGITEAGRLDDLVPALTVQPSATGNVAFIRGVGNFTTTSVSDPAIAFNDDGVYVGRTTGMTAFYDLDRIEVLKGPQGTLYGRNATGGAINVIPTRPKAGEFSGYLTGSYGSYDDIKLEGALNAPLGADGAFRLSGTILSHDGYYSDGTSDEKTQALRAQLFARLTPDLTVRVVGDYSHQGGAGIGSRYVGRYQLTGAGYAFIPSGRPKSEGLFAPASQAFRQTAFVFPTGRFAAPLTAYPERDNNFWGAHAEINYETGIGALTIIPAWRYGDLDYASSNPSFEFSQLETDEQFSLEARLTGNRVGMFDYVIGGYYFDETIHANQAVFASALLSAQNQNFGTKSLAPFARLTAHVSDALRLVGGVRYTHEKKALDQDAVTGVLACQIMTPFGPSCPGAPLFSFVDNLTVSTLNRLTVPFPARGQFPPVVPAGGGAIAARSDSIVSLRKTQERVTWRAAVEYDVAPRSLLYASVETGFRSGGFSGTPGFEAFGPESITAYTIGAKNRFLDNRLQLNLEGFYWDYKNQQANFVGVDINGATAQRVGNIASSRIAGAEAEARFLATPTTLLSADVQYLDTKVKSFVYATPSAGPPPVTSCAILPNANPALVNVDCSGRPAFNSPKWTLNLDAQQTIPLGDLQLVMSADTQYKSKRYQAFNYTPETLIPGQWRSNAQVSFGAADSRWSVSAFVQNIENHRTASFLIVAPLTNFLVESSTAPRTYGVRGSVKF